MTEKYSNKYQRRKSADQFCILRRCRAFSRLGELHKAGSTLVASRSQICFMTANLKLAF